ncbi:hypothetical protein [Ruegeria marina]|uniref:Endonuclease III n=1 Tax=Ruegeria marina TaxID=639004 RepID=A0A1G6IA35_9RHOB|nr:hypothetical protein [Ruegeria marina]SDC03409.1 Endonuclease III [Ruegeria marina]
MTTETDLVLDRLLDRHGTLFSEELGLDLARNSPSVLFQWLCGALVMSARISHEIAIEAARALSDAGWTTADRMAQSSWDDRVEVLNRAGYARIDARTARMLGETAERAQDEYEGDLRKLREASGRDPEVERAALRAFKGVGDVGADIFFREMQMVWSEHYPFLDRMARNAAKRLGVPETPDTLAEWAGRESYPHLVTGLVRAELKGIDRSRLLETGEGAAS